jgi:hypothetical protein
LLFFGTLHNLFVWPDLVLVGGSKLCFSRGSQGLPCCGCCPDVQPAEIQQQNVQLIHSNRAGKMLFRAGSAPSPSIHGFPVWPKHKDGSLCSPFPINFLFFRFFFSWPTSPLIKCRRPAGGLARALPDRGCCEHQSPNREEGITLALASTSNYGSSIR